MTTMPDMQLKAGEQPRLAAGTWRVSPPQSHASFAARMAGRTVRGHLPLTGEVQITEPIEGSAARLAAVTSAVRTGSAALDRLLAGPAFLDAMACPEISFRSELLVWVPTGWRAVGRLRVKNAEHELACQFGVHRGDTRPGRAPRTIIAGSWVTTRPGLPASESRPSAGTSPWRAHFTSNRTRERLGTPCTVVHVAFRRPDPAEPSCISYRCYRPR